MTGAIDTSGQSDEEILRARRVASTGRGVLLRLGEACCFHRARRVASTGRVDRPRAISSKSKRGVLLPLGATCCLHWARRVASTERGVLAPLGEACCFHWARRVASTGRVNRPGAILRKSERGVLLPLGASTDQGRFRQSPNAACCFH